MKKYICVSFVVFIILICVGSVTKSYADDGKGNIIVVSMGDSYSSGEGIEPFYGQYSYDEKKTENPDWLAHRSVLSWPGRLVFPELGVPLKDAPRGSYNNGILKPGNWFFVASSGATTEHLLQGQIKETKQKNIFHKDQHVLEAQCSVLYALRVRGIYADYITLTIGGNDVDFRKIVTSAALGGDQFGILYTLPTTLDTVWQKFYSGGVREKIRQAYKDVWNANGKQGMILVAGYPRLVDEDGKGLPFSKDEAKRLNDAVSQFNNELEKIVNECRNGGMNIWFIRVEEEFQGKGAYAKDGEGRDIALINPIIPTAQSEDLNLFALVSAYSMHPNSNGAEAYARSVQKFIDKSLPDLIKNREKG